MASVHETAYPRLNPNPRRGDLEAVFTPSLEELALAERIAVKEGPRIGFLVTLKTFQRLGYFVYLRDVPPAITEHVVRCLGFLFVPATLAGYDASGTRVEHLSAIRAHQGVQPYRAGGLAVVERATREAARTKDDLRDLINVAVEELARHRFELPGFSTLRKEAQRARAEVNAALLERVREALTPEDRARLESLFTEPGDVPGQTGWARVKRDPGKASLANFKLLVEHRAWMRERQPGASICALLPEAKYRQFAAEADSLDAARMGAVEPVKRLALSAVLVEAKAAKVLDDLGDLFVKRVMNIHRSGKDALERYQREHRERTDALVKDFKRALVAYRSDGTPVERIGAIGAVIGDRAEALIAQCEEHEAYADNNYYPFLWRFYAGHRATLFRVCRLVSFRSTVQDSGLLLALAFLLERESSRGRGSRSSEAALTSAGSQTGGGRSSPGSRAGTRRPSG